MRWAGVTNQYFATLCTPLVDEKAMSDEQVLEMAGNLQHGVPFATPVFDGAAEEDVRAKGIAYECGVARFAELSRGQIMGISSGMLKLIVDIATHKVLGVHIIGEGATELIHIGQAVINLGGKLDYFIDNSFNYPTLAEANKYAAGEWKRNHQPLKVLEWLRRFHAWRLN